MKTDSIRRVVRFAGLALSLSWLPGSVNGQSAESFGVSVNTSTLKQKTLAIVSPAGGGMAQAKAGTITAGSYVTTAEGFAIASGESDGSNSDAVSSVTLGNVNILDGLITAECVIAMASSTQSNRNTDGSSFVNLIVNGVSLSDPAPNTRIDLPDVGYVLLNERINQRGGITVNMIHVVLESSTTGDIIVGSATSK